VLLQPGIELSICWKAPLPPPPTIALSLLPTSTPTSPHLIPRPRDSYVSGGGWRVGGKWDTAPVWHYRDIPTHCSKIKCTQLPPSQKRERRDSLEGSGTHSQCNPLHSTLPAFLV